MFSESQDPDTLGSTTYEVPGWECSDTGDLNGVTVSYRGTCSDGLVPPPRLGVGPLGGEVGGYGVGTKIHCHLDAKVGWYSFRFTVEKCSSLTGLD